MPETTTFSLQKLVKISLRKNTSTKAFTSLYKQLDERSPIPDAEYVSTLLTVDHYPGEDINDGHKGKVSDYAIAVVLTSESELHKFWQLLPKADLNDQISYISKFNKIVSTGKFTADVKKLVNRCLLDDLLKYVHAFLGSHASGGPLSALQKNLLYKAVLFVDSVLQNHTLNINPGTYKPQLMNTVSDLKNLGRKDLSVFLAESCYRVLGNNFLPESSIIAHGAVGSAPVGTTATSKSNSASHIAKNISTLNPNSPKVSELTSIKKYLWLNHLMSHWLMNNEKKFLSQYESLFNSFGASQSSKKNTGHSLAVDITTSVFNGLAIYLSHDVSSFVVFNWVNFIIIKLPAVLSLISFPAPNSDNSSSLEGAILSTFNSLSESTAKTLSTFSWSNENFDIRKAFLKSCLYNQLVSLNAFHSTFPEETSRLNETVLNTDLQRLSSINSIESELSLKLLEVNSEFTSLQESGLIDYVNSLPDQLRFSPSKQQELAEVTVQIIDKLIEEKDAEKLNRLMIALMNEYTTLNIIFFNDTNNRGPFYLLEKLIPFIDYHSFNVEDDDNFQDGYAYFGVILLGAITIIEKFGVDLSQLSISNSFFVDYINNFHYRLCENLTTSSDSNEEEDITIISNYNNLMGEWINALFDDSNDGLSDDLLKAINVKQIYKVIPLIYQQAIVAMESGKINDEILNNGIDYLSQAFLVPCTLSIINWILTRIDLEATKPTYDAKGHLWIKVLFEILKSNLNESIINDTSDLNSSSLGDDESNLIFKLVLKLSGESIIDKVSKFNHWNNVELIKKSVNIIRKVVDPNYTRRDIEQHKPRFDRANNLNLLDDFKNDVMTLINCEDVLLKPISSYTFLIEAVSVIDKNDFIRYLISEVDMYQKNHMSEESKILINLLSFIVLLDAPTTCKNYTAWVSALDAPPRNKNGVSNAEQSDEGFSLPMEYNYSTIFNDLGIYSEEEQSDSGKMEEDEDDLFNESPRPKIGSKEQELRMFLSHYSEYEASNNLMNELITYIQHYVNGTTQAESNLGKTLAILKSKIRSDIQAYS